MKTAAATNLSPALKLRSSASRSLDTRVSSGIRSPNPTFDDAQHSGAASPAAAAAAPSPPPPAAAAATPAAATNDLPSTTGNSSKSADE